MTMVQLKGIQTWVDKRHAGSQARYYLRGKYSPTGKPIKLPDPVLVGPDAFQQAYMAARAGKLDQQPIIIGLDRSKPGTIAGLVADLKASPEYAAVEGSTRASYDSLLEGIRKDFGDLQIATCSTQDMKDAFAKKVKVHSKGYANKWLRMMRRLFEIAVANGIRPDNPCLRVKALKQKRVDVEDGLHSWSEDEIEDYEAKYLEGTQARLAMAIMLYTCQRKSDSAGMGRQHLSVDRLTGRRMIKVRQIKTGKWVKIPLDPRLAKLIDMLPEDQQQFLVTAHGKKPSKKTLGDWMRGWCNEAGLPECRSHGLRKACCRRLAEAGLSEDEIALHSGHTDMRTLRIYVGMANKTVVAMNAADKLEAHRKRMKAMEVADLKLAA